MKIGHSNSLPRFITPASINIGDTIKVEWETPDVTHTRTGVVAKREYDGHMRVYTTKNGTELFRWHPSHKEHKITLLAIAKSADTQQALFDLLELNCE